MVSELKIYVAEGCSGCLEARHTAFQIKQDYPELSVKVIDIGSAGESIPDDVFATPTYMLNNRIVSLGNPDPTDIVRWITNAADNENGR